MGRDLLVTLPSPARLALTGGAGFFRSDANTCCRSEGNVSTKTEPAEVPAKPKRETDPEKLAKARGGPQCRTCRGWRPYPSGVACPLCVPRAWGNR